MGAIGFLDSQKWSQSMSNAMVMAMEESCKRNDNGRALGVQCVRAMPCHCTTMASNLPQLVLAIFLPGPRAAAESSAMEMSCLKTLVRHLTCNTACCFHAVCPHGNSPVVALACTLSCFVFSQFLKLHRDVRQSKELSVLRSRCGPAPRLGRTRS
jgi:hypothetical protein